MEKYDIIMADTRQLLEQCRKIRYDVFVCEKKVDPSIEQDEQDILGGACSHFLIECNGVSVGAFRCMSEESSVKLQRLCVLKQHRGKGAGAAALKYIERHYSEMGMREIYLDSKCESSEFYIKLGYIAASESFIEAGVPHVRMSKELRGNI